MRLFSCILLLTFSTIVFAQKGYDTSNASFLFEQVSSSNSYSPSFQNSINTIAQDKYGFMWFGTQTGVERFDGYRFNDINEVTTPDSFSIKGNINHLICSGEVLWVIANDKELYRIKYDGINDFYYKKEKIEFNSNLKIKSICKGKDEDGSIFVCDEKNNVFFFNQYNKRPSVYTLNNNQQIIKIFFVDKNFLYSTIKDGIEQTYNYNIEKGMNFLLKDEAFLNYTFDNNNGKIYAATKDKIYSSNKTDLIFNQLNIKSSSIQEVNSLLFDSYNNLWIGTERNGLFVYTQNNEIVNYTRSNKQFSLNSSLILSLYQSKEGVVWIGTNGGGLNKWHPDRQLFHHYFQDEKISDVWSICGDNKSIFLGTETGTISRYNKESLYKYINKSEKKYDKINSSIVALDFFDDKYLLVGTRKGVYKLSKNLDFNYKLIYPINNITVVKKWGDKILVGTKDSFMVISLDSSIMKEYKYF